jgi:hypothetical protein
MFSLFSLDMSRKSVHVSVFCSCLLEDLTIVIGDNSSKYVAADEDVMETRASSARLTGYLSLPENMSEYLGGSHICKSVCEIP